MKKEEMYNKLVCNLLGVEEDTLAEINNELSAAVESVLKTLPGEERSHLLNVIQGIEQEDEKYRVTIRRLRYPLRSKPIRDVIRGDEKMNKIL